MNPQPAARYFFLSYAHTPPTPGARGDTEHWVKVLFDDLTLAVRRHADPTRWLAPGFCEAALPPGVDRNAALSDALGGAEVFVPLYSPYYFTKRWPQRELATYKRRLAGLGEHRQRRRIAPVLWIPIPKWQRDEEIDRAIAFADDVPSYADDGLRALRTLSVNHAHYHTVVDRLAVKIVEIAEAEPLGPATTPLLLVDPMDEALTNEAPLVVSVLTGADVADPGQWRPFGDRQELPAAESVVNMAERFSLRARSEGAPGSTATRYQFPTVLLVDPWLLAAPDGAATLRRMVADAPQWVTPLVLVDRTDPARLAEADRLAALAREILPAQGDKRAYWAHDPAEFAAVTPDVVTAVYRHYLQHAGRYPPKDPQQLPSTNHRSRPER